MKRSIAFAVVSIMAATLAAGASPETVICGLFDLSQSANQVRKSYLADFDSIVDQLKGGEQVLGAGITANTLATGRFEVRGEAPKFNSFLDNKLAYPKKLQAAQKSLKQQAEALLREPATATTDLLGAMQLAGKAFASDTAKAAKMRRLVVFSDMVEESAQHNFRRENLTALRIQSLLAEERNAGRMPDLKGVEVWVSGAGGADRDRYVRIQDFWIHYFQAAGASLRAAHYGATLMDFQQ